METLISETFLYHSKLQFSSLSQFHLRPTSLKSRVFLKFSNPRWSFNSKKPIFCYITASNPSNYGGWDDLKLIEDSNQSGKLDQIRNFMVSVGIDDRKHVFMFVLGFASALAISRVRVSSILVFPASVLVFAVGFSLGFVRGSGIGLSMKEINRNGNKKTSKEENSSVSDEKLRNLVEVFSEVDVKVAKLEKEMKGALASNRVQVHDLESYINVIKSVSFDILCAKNLMKTSIIEMGSSSTVGDSKGESVEDREIGNSSNQKSNRRKREPGASYFDIFQLFGGLFRENSNVEKPNKVKDIAKKELMEPLSSEFTNNQINGSSLFGRIEEDMVLNPVYENNIGNMEVLSSPREASINPNLNQHGTEVLGDEVRKMKVLQGMVKENSMETVSNIKTPLKDEEFSQYNSSFRFMNNHGKFMKLGHQNENGIKVSHDGLGDQFDLDVNTNAREIELGPYAVEDKDSLIQEHTLKTSNGAYVPSYGRKKGQNGIYRFDFRGGRGKSGDEPKLGNQRAASDMEEDSASSSSSMISEDLVFDKHLTEATDLLKQARECLKGKLDEERAEIILYKSARLLSRAIAMKPMSLLAVGQLGNTFLLHGELKLRISRELRTLLSRSNSLSKENARRVPIKGFDDQVMSKERIASVLVDVCEECEELLVEAGTKYRMALSIDGSDLRALYNWGLALSYRAQLIADIGPGAAFDADKLYLAAIDKFDAMMSRSNAYAPDALFRWGIALQQRSHLRPSNSKEKVKLLHQAKRLLEDALCMDSNNLQVREALSSCIYELNNRQF